MKDEDLFKYVIAYIKDLTPTQLIKLSNEIDKEAGTRHNTGLMRTSNGWVMYPWSKNEES